MMARCDHCRGKLGLRVRRYWRMRFCSPACVAAYQERLVGDTMAKISLLDLAVIDPSPTLAPTLPLRLARKAARQILNQSGRAA